MRIGLDRILCDDSGLLGPGRRMELWFHGCQRNCPGCITKEHNHQPEPMLSLSVQAVYDAIQNEPEIEGITISGGEPFLQSEALLQLAALVHKRGLGIILYSGYLYEELCSSPQFREILSYLDVLIDGPYLWERDDGRAYRGSSNQRLHHLTDRYQSFYQKDRVRECRIEQQGSYLTLTGIPDAASREIWKHLKQGGNIK